MKIEEINLPKEQKKALLSLIDLKTDHEMEKSLIRFEAAINALKADMDVKLTAIDNKFTSQFNLLKWLIGGIGGFIACLAILITILKYIG